mmetsp:Transcript_74828/g.148256  ORF Transcript_74828/g.148256 Transcript_74828/m.148256 type:complete len:221 (+) Transcript_74828:198-860(+)
MRLHRDHHPGFQDHLVVLAQFEDGFPPVVVAHDPQRVSIPKRAVLEAALALVDLVQFLGNVAQLLSRLQHLATLLKHLHIHVPVLEVLFGNVVAKVAGALQGRIVPVNHGEHVERQQILLAQRLAGERIVGAISVDAGLEPDPRVAHLGRREFFGDQLVHLLKTSLSDFPLLHALFHGSDGGVAALVGHFARLANQLHLLLRLHQALLHQQLRYIGEFEQ